MSTSSVTVGALVERAPGEHRVSVTPNSIARLDARGVHVLVEAGAGAGSWISDAEFETAGAEIASTTHIIDTADAITCVGTPPADVLASLRPGQFLVGLLHTATDPDLIRSMSAQSVVGIDLALLPRTLSNAQSMDAMTSQDSVAGYKAVIVAAGAFGRYFPMMITAAGTFRPTRLLVLGAGIAGLQAIATARRLGADVSGYDIRAECRSQIESLGARFVELGSTVAGASSNGSARTVTADEATVQQNGVNSALAAFDVVITTARVPGHRPPVLVTARAVQQMRSGSVVLDMAASELGGNVEGSIDNTTTQSSNGVTVIGAGSLASTMPSAASEAYGRNISDVLIHFVRDHVLRVDSADPIDAAVVLSPQVAVAGIAS
ncbi:NAD(P) transhydrogenase subunit alpha [Rhodococcus sp. BS-15]|uniref:NAD(P) transhydrogenase subunit alpha n=1 Tax=Rhodococcus sp. BS-15 TaxID=1304954 RepID=UPI000A6EB120|nr:NAD(P) transhydrogenase subunit alpha [Rhodococcus sp. BS-15]